MTTAHYVVKARKSYRDDQIKKGEGYWWWKFRRSGIYRSKTQPKPSQLTRSEFWSTILGIFEELSELGITHSYEELQDARDTAVDALNELAYECEEKKNNIPESLQESDTGQMLDERAEGARECASELEGIDLEGEDKDLEEGEDDPDKQSVIEEIQAVSYSGS